MISDYELLRQKYSPEGSPLREHQLKMMEELKLLDKICKENHLTYFLTGGSVLGTVRHKGFIPWDDDIDIALLEKDYKKLIKILLETESETYVLQCKKTDFNYTFAFPKFRAKEGDLLGCFPARGILYKYKGYGIDVFCVSRHSYQRAWLCAKMRAALLNWMYRIKNEKLRCFVTRVNWFFFDFLRPLTFPLDLFRKEGELHYDLGMGLPYHHMREQEIFPLRQGRFEDFEVPIPGNAEAFLERIYGNFMEIPSEEAIRESIHSKNFLPKN